MVIFVFFNAGIIFSSLQKILIKQDNPNIEEPLYASACKLLSPRKSMKPICFLGVPVLFRFVCMPVHRHPRFLGCRVECTSSK